MHLRGVGYRSKLTRTWTLGQASGAAEGGFKEKKGNNANVRGEETGAGVNPRHKSSCMIGMTEAEPRNR